MLVVGQNEVHVKRTSALFDYHFFFSFNFYVKLCVNEKGNREQKT